MDKHAEVCWRNKLDEINDAIDAYLSRVKELERSLKVAESDRDTFKRYAAKMEPVVDAARAFVDQCDCGCRCGYYTDDATEETGMNICGACATKEALSELDTSTCVAKVEVE